MVNKANIEFFFKMLNDSGINYVLLKNDENRVPGSVNDGDDIDILRTIGMNNNQVIKMIIRQNLFYPFIGTLFGLFPLLMCQLLFNYVYRKVSTGEWEYGLYESGATIPWYSNIPFQYNLFEFGVFDSLVMCVLVGFCLILIGTIPQIVYIKKHKLING